jgi:mono/diheme cytochrome c family protein
VGTIAITALPQASELIDGIAGLVGTQYGRLALVKLGLFFAALGLACVNRLVLTARLGSDVGRRQLIGSIAVEAVAGMCVVLAAAAMASSMPAAHAQPVWPFPWRPSLAAWAEPDSRAELVRLLAASTAGLALIVAGVFVRRIRIGAVCIAVLIVLPFLPALALLLVEAYPTSYAHSATGFSVAAITRGQALFPVFCAACHDPRNGSGGAADLTAPHVWEHLEGELFWRVTDGIADPRGAALMPAFGSTLPEDDRWALVDFVRARNAGLQVRSTGTWPGLVPAPETSVICDGSDAEELADLRDRVLLVTAGDFSVHGPALGRGGDGEPDRTIIRLIQHAAVRPAPGACIAAATKAWDAWAVIAGVSPDRFAGFLTIVDGRGWLRASLPPGTGIDRIRAAIADAHDHPLAAAAGRSPGPHRH